MCISKSKGFFLNMCNIYMSIRKYKLGKESREKFSNLSKITNCTFSGSRKSK